MNSSVKQVENDNSDESVKILKVGYMFLHNGVKFGVFMGTRVAQW